MGGGQECLAEPPVFPQIVLSGVGIAAAPGPLKGGVN